MITVVKGSSKLVVTKGTFEEQLKPLGYRIASEDKGATQKVAPLLKEKEEKIDKQETEEDSLNKKFGLEEKTSTSKKGR
jgi:hypothetical protein